MKKLFIVAMLLTDAAMAQTPFYKGVFEFDSVGTLTAFSLTWENDLGYTTETVQDKASWNWIGTDVSVKGDSIYAVSKPVHGIQYRFAIPKPHWTVFHPTQAMQLRLQVGPGEVSFWSATTWNDTVSIRWRETANREIDSYTTRWAVRRGERTLYGDLGNLSYFDAFPGCQWRAL